MPDEKEPPVLSSQQLRKRLYALSLASVFVPPIAGNAILLFAEVFPFPDFIWLFTDAGGLVMLVFVGLALSVVPWLHRLIIELPDRDREDATRVLRKLRLWSPWALLGFVVVYSVVGLYSADLALQRLGLELQTIREVPLLAFSPVPVAIITAFPIYFVFCDTLGRYLAPRGVVRSLLPLRFRLMVLGTATPFFIDSFLLGYFYVRTGYLNPESLGVWLILLVLAGVGTLFAERGIRQSIEPLTRFLNANGDATTKLTPNTLDELGELTGLLADLVTEKERALADLREVQRNARLGRWSLTNHNKMSGSGEIWEILGISGERQSIDLVSFARLFDPRDADRLTRDLSRKKPFRLNLALKDGGKGARTILFDATPNRDSAESMNGWSGFLQDITESVAKERQLQAAQRLESIGKLTGGAAHDFNNLLAIILGNLELLKETTKDAEQLEFIESGIDATKRGSDLTRNMLSFARRATLEPVKVDLNNTVRNMKNWLARTIPATIEVETSLLAGLWTVEIDPALAENAILNLVLNARDAMNAGGKLTIETANLRIDDEYIRSREEELEPGRYVMLAISDTGTGIRSDLIDSVFEPFFSTKPVGEGAGMGLPMVQGFMKQSGGTVRVYSEPEVGTTVKLYFKAVEAGDEAGIVSSTDEDWSPVDGEGAKILLVEDEEGVLNALRKTIEGAGYQVQATQSGDAAYKIFIDDPVFDLVITDIVMPGDFQGTTLAREIRRRHPKVPFVFLSGYANEATVHGNGLRSTDIRLMKPVSRKDLLKSIETLLRNP